MCKQGPSNINTNDKQHPKISQKKHSKFVKYKNLNTFKVKRFQDKNYNRGLITSNIKEEFKYLGMIQDRRERKNNRCNVRHFGYLIRKDRPIDIFRSTTFLFAASRLEKRTRR